MQLLFGEPLELTHREREALLPSLVRACRPPAPDAQAALITREGRFLAPNTIVNDEQLASLTASFLEPLGGGD